MSRPLPSLNALRAFEAAARLESVSRAATELHVTHGAVSRQIKLLEEDLGQPLFVRDGRGLALTPAGMRLRDAAGRAFEQLQAAVAELRLQARPDAFVLGCPGSLLARWMIPRLPQLAVDLPALTLHLAAQEHEPSPAANPLDGWLFLGEAPWPPGWQVEVLAPECIGPVLAPALLPALGNSASPRAVLDEPLLHALSRPQAWPAWAQLNGLDPGRLRLGTAFPHLYHLLEAAVNGIGIAIAPQELVATDLAAGRLVAPWGFSATGGSWAFAIPAGRQDPRAGQLADWLRRQLQAARTG